MSNELQVTQGEKSVDAHIGARLRARRELVRLSADELAIRLGIDTAELSAMEEGRVQIPSKTLLVAADEIGVAPRYFFQGFNGYRSESAEKLEATPWLREVDRWFRNEVSPHEGLFLKVAYRMVGNMEVARDLLHDAYAKILSDDTWRSVKNAKAYVRQAVSNAALDHIKHNKIVPMDQYADIEAFGVMDLTPDAYQMVADRERLQTVMKAVEKMPQQCRQVFIMRRIDDLPPKEIAKRLGIALTTVEVYLTRGLTHLHRHLESHRKTLDLKLWVARRVTVEAPEPEAEEERR